MDEQQVTATLDTELRRIPAGAPGSAQDALRRVYRDVRRDGLAENDGQPRSQAFREAVALVRRDFPDFEPILFQPGYFGWPP